MNIPQEHPKRNQRPIQRRNETKQNKLVFSCEEVEPACEHMLTVRGWQMSQQTREANSGDSKANTTHEESRKQNDAEERIDL